MRFMSSAAALILGAALLSGPALGQTASAPAVAPVAKAKKEPTARQLAARERQTKCAAEWKTAKAAGKTTGQTWPQYWSSCNARLKGSNV